MTTLSAAIFYNGHDNVYDVTLTEDGVAISHASITRLQIMMVDDDGGLSVLSDSQTDPTSFSFGTSNLTMKIGQMGIAAGEYLCKLNVFGTDAPNGIVWEPSFPIVVI
jgi:hypothetical protein